MQFLFTATFISKTWIRTDFISKFSLPFSAAILLVSGSFFFQIVQSIFERSQKIAETKRLEKQKCLQMQKEKELTQRGQKFAGIEHTIRQKLFVVYNNLRKKDYGSALRHFKKIYGETHAIPYYTFCSDYMINAILNSKYRLAEDLKIKIEYNIVLPEQHTFSSKELCCILFNLLDNGIESCKNTSSPHLFIQLTIHTKSDFLIIHMKNSKSSQKIFDRLTSKEDSVVHGFGLSIIEEISANNDGICKWTDYGDTFDSVVMIRFRNFSLPI